MMFAFNRATRCKQIRRIQGYGNITTLCHGSFEKEKAVSCFREARVNKNLNPQTLLQPYVWFSKPNSLPMVRALHSLTCTRHALDSSYHLKRPLD